MKACAQLYLFRPIWIITAVAGLHATADCLRAHHEIFDERVIQKWKDYEIFSHSLQGVARVQRIIDGKSQESTFRFKQNRECALIIGPHNRDPLLSLCSLANPHYMAQLDLSKTDPGNTVLHDYKPISGDGGAVSPFELVFMELSRHFYYRGKSLRETVLEPSFKVIGSVKEIQNGQELARIDYIYNQQRHVGNQDIHHQYQGSLWLDPSRCWCIRRSKFSAQATAGGERISDTDSDVVCETIDHPSGVPILKSVTEQVKRFQYKNKRKTEGSSKKVYELEVNDSVPDSEFTLSAFGLPEPGGAEPVKTPMPMYVWIFVAAGVCGAFAFVFRYLARRRSLAAPAG